LQKIGDSKPPFAFLSDIWSNKWIKFLVFVAFCCAVLGAFALVWPVLKLFVVALVLAYLFDPLVDRFEKLRFGRSAAVGLLIFLILAFTVGFIALIIPILASNAADFIARFPTYYMKAQNWAQPILMRSMRNLPVTAEDWINGLKDYGGILQSVGPKVLASLGNTLRGTFSGISGFIVSLLNFVVVPVAWFYLLRDFDPMKRKVLELVPIRWRAQIESYALETDEVISKFMRGQLTVCVILGLIYSLGLEFIAGVPMGIIIGLLAGLLSIVPYLGLIIGIGPAIVLALLEHGDLLHPLLVVVVFAVAQALEGNLITPKIVGEKLGLHPVTVIFAILVWGMLLGLTGMVIAVPLTAVIVVFGKKLVAHYRKSEFYRFGITQQDDE
jgi:predicted PurR-regulated permease PerM